MNLVGILLYRRNVNLSTRGLVSPINRHPLSPLLGPQMPWSAAVRGHLAQVITYSLVVVRHIVNAAD